MLFFFGYPVELYRKRYVIRIDNAELFDQFHADNAELLVKKSIHNQQEKKSIIFLKFTSKVSFFYFSHYFEIKAFLILRGLS